jgi:hypothetical protein
MEFTLQFAAASASRSHTALSERAQFCERASTPIQA